MRSIRTVWAPAILALSLAVASCSTIESDVPMSEWSEQGRIDAEWEIVVAGLAHPWAVAWLDDGRMLITERDGRLWLVLDTGDRTEVVGVPDVYAEGQGGLLDVSVGPDDVAAGWIYLAFSTGNQDANRTEVHRFRLDESGERPALVGGQVVFVNNEYKSGRQHFGSRIAWKHDGTMLISVGDGGNPPLRFEGEVIREQAQEPSNLFGSVVRVNPDGSIPEDNPFVNVPDHRPEAYSIGIRNIQGLAIDDVSGTIWASEHGARGGDELNRLRPGENYGWPLVTHSREYVRFTRISRFQTREGYIDPQMVWIGTVAPSGLAVHGRTLYAGGLVSQSVHVIEVDSDGAFVSERTISIGERVRDVRIGPDNGLWVLTDDPEDGRLLRVSGF